MLQFDLTNVFRNTIMNVEIIIEVIDMLNKSMKNLLLLPAVLGLSLSLVACGQKSSSTSSSSSAAKSSQMSSVSSDKKASKTSTSSETMASSEEETSANPNMVNTSDIPIPAELVGTWTGKSQQASSISMVITADGQVSTEVQFGQEGEEPVTKFSGTAKLVEIGPNLYAWDKISGDFEAFLPGIRGLGGVGKTALGFYLEDGLYTPVQFTSGADGEINYGDYSPFPVALSK